MIWTDSDEDGDLALEGLDNGRCFLLLRNMLVDVLFITQITNSYILSGKPDIKTEGAKIAKPSKPVPLVGASAKQAKGVVPKKEEEDDSDDDSDDEIADEDDSGSSDEVFQFVV